MIKYLGIDWGEARIGLALADSETKIATPFRVAESLDEVIRAIEGEKIDVVVVGAPYRMSNVECPLGLARGRRMSNDFLIFFDLLKKKVKVPVHLIDERLSSKAADALTGNKKVKAERDAVAAMLILQTYLDNTKITNIGRIKRNI